MDLAGNFQQVQNQMSAMGMTQKEMAEATVRASALAAKNIHVGVTEIMEMNRHAIEIFGGADAAAEHIGLMAKLADLQHRWQAGHTGAVGPDVVTSIRDMMKTGEGGILWGKDPRIFDTFAENLMKSLWATGANVSASAYVKAMRASKGAFAGWDDDFKFGIFPAMVQEWQGAGVGASTAYSKIGAGARWRKQGILEGQMMGIISPEADPKHPNTMRPEYIKGISLFRADPKMWFDQVVKPVLDKEYGPLSLMNTGERQGQITRLLSDPNAAEFLNRMDREGAKYEKDRPLWHKAKLDMPDGWAEALVAFEAKWQDLMVALGTPSLKDATSALGAITKAIINLTGVLSEHPDAAKNFLGIAAGFGVAMTTLGALAVSYGMAGLLGGGVIVVGLTALTGGLAGLAAANWATVTSGIQGLIDKLNALSDVCRAAVSKIGDAVAWLWEKIKSFVGGGDTSGFGTPWNHAIPQSFHGGGFGGGGITKAAWSGGGGGVTGGGYSGPGAPSGGSHLGGLVNVGGSSFHFGSGGGGSQHIPYGDYPITPGAIGAWGQAHGAIGLNNNAIWDSTLGRMRRGIEMHAGHNSALFTAGCLAIAKGEWPQFKSKVQELMRLGDGANLHVGPGGASITPRHHGHGGETHVHNHIYMDGKEIARGTVKHLVRSAQYPTSVGRQDGRGVFMGPGAEVFA